MSPADQASIDLTELCARYRKLYMPAVCDALYGLGLPELVLPSALRPLFAEQRIVGAAYTVQGQALKPFVNWDEGVGLIRTYLDIFEELTPDSVLVSVNPDSRVGHFGELTANAAKKQGCAGCILDGNLRDTEGMRAIGFQVFYRDLSPLNAIGRWSMAAKQVPVTIGGVTVSPGDIIFGEFDGVLVVPRQHAAQVLVQAEEIVGSEARVRQEVSTTSSPWASFERHGHI